MRHRIVYSEVPVARDLDLPIQLHRLAAKAHGIDFASVDLHCSLRLSGAMDVRHKMTVVALTEGITAIEHYLAAPEAPGDGHINMRFWEIGVPTGITLSPDIVNRTPGNLSWKIRVVPELPVDTLVTYALSNTLPPGSFAMSLDELQQRSVPFEFYYYRPLSPVQNLSILLEFPRGFSPSQVAPDTWYGLAHVRNRDEFVRASSQESWTMGELPNGQVWARLSIVYPIVGLLYAITWIP